MKIVFMLLVFGTLLLSTVLVSAEGNHQTAFEEGKELAESRTGCDEFDDEQLEAIGEYFMEQMHPSEQHDIMHEMMGIEEGTEYHKQFHVNIAQMTYCSQGGMMGMMPMMGMMGGQSPQTNMMQGMMGRSAWSSSSWLWSSVGLAFWIAVVAALILLAVWLYKKTGGAKNDSALEILKKRFARGEINKKQYQSVREQIG